MELSTQSELCEIFPKLKQDLLEGKGDTLARFKVPRHQYQVKELTSPLEKLLFSKMCIAASQVIERQCDREYNPNPGPLAPPRPRGTVICEQTEEQLEGLPTNNLINERDFSVFDRRSKQPAKTANKCFTGQNLKNDMTLLHADPELTNTAKKVGKMLNEREYVWNQEQKQLKSMNDEKKYRKAQNTYAYQNRVLAACKTWGGPCQSVDELNAALLRADNEAKCITQEITYYKLTHMSEFSANRQLFRVRGISNEEKLENLYQILSLSEDSIAERAGVVLPSNQEVLQTLQQIGDGTTTPPAQQI